MSAKILQFANNGLSGLVAGRSSATNTTVAIAGLKELLKGLAALPDELAKGPIYAALRGAGNIVRQEAIARAPVLNDNDPMALSGRRKPGTIRRAIRVSRSRINKGQNGLYEVIVRVKPLKAAQRKKFKQASGKAGRDNPDDPFYWWWVEFGTSKMAKRPFLRPAFAETKSQQLEAMRKRMAAGIARAAAKIRQEVDRRAA
jgi:HK97 gp10 family phage protein